MKEFENSSHHVKEERVLVDRLDAVKSQNFVRYQIDHPAQETKKMQQMKPICFP